MTNDTGGVGHPDEAQTLTICNDCCTSTWCTRLGLCLSEAHADKHPEIQRVPPPGAVPAAPREECNILAREIVEVAKRLGITDASTPLTGPEVLLLLREIERAAAAVPAAQDARPVCTCRHDSGMSTDCAVHYPTAPASHHEEPQEQTASLSDFHGEYNTREHILHRRCQRAESDVARLTKREQDALTQLDELARRFVHAIAARERCSLELRQLKASIANAKEK